LGRRDGGREGGRERERIRNPIHLHGFDYGMGRGTMELWC